jgi:DNA polymerase III delta subunit
MLTIISTGDRESDLYWWNELKKKLPKNDKLRSFDCLTEQDTSKLEQRVETIALLEESQTLIVHQPSLTPELAAKLENHTDDVYVITPVGRLPKLASKVKVISEKITDAGIKSAISRELTKLELAPERDLLLRTYLSLTTEDFTGKEHLSPAKALVFLRQLQILADLPQPEKQRLFELLIGTSEGKTSQWEILDHLFSQSKRKQHDYFRHLSESMSTYEIMALAKSTLLLVLAITSGQQAHLDNASIAAKLGKHPFYVSSIARTISAKNISFEKAHRLVQRLFNLETTLKSGRLDDESIGFDFLLATSV